METNGPLRVALPDEAQINKSNKTATVKPFQSPNSKNQNKSGMGDNKKGDSSDAFDLSGMNDEDEIDEDEDMEVYEVGSDSADEEYEF